MRCVLLALMVSAGCSSCPGKDLHVEGDYGFVRCAQLPAPAEGEIEVGDLHLRSSGRTLTIEGLPAAPELAAFSGPAPAPVRADHVAAVGTRTPDLGLVLGGLGDDDKALSATLAELGKLPFPVLILSGGRDNVERLADRHAALGPDVRRRLVLLDPYRSVRFAGHEFVVLPGAEGGRYGVSDGVCGFDREDLAQLAKDLGPEGDGLIRSMWSWTAPARGGVFAVSRTHLGLDAGSISVAEFAQSVGARGGLFAWPTVRAAQPASSDGKQALSVDQALPDLRMVVPRLGALSLLRSDGSRVPPGFVLLQVDPDGVRLRGRVDVDDLPPTH